MRTSQLTMMLSSTSWMRPNQRRRQRGRGVGASVSAAKAMVSGTVDDCDDCVYKSCVCGSIPSTEWSDS